uniref:Uncharacterized protein n=1 Tax=Arundo donax TaxID=35708 RepID=A0A0A9CD76_ARUDO
MTYEVYCITDCGVLGI